MIENLILLGISCVALAIACYSFYTIIRTKTRNYRARHPKNIYPGDPEWEKYLDDSEFKADYWEDQGIEYDGENYSDAEPGDLWQSDNGDLYLLGNDQTWRLVEKENKH